MATTVEDLHLQDPLEEDCSQKQAIEIKSEHEDKIQTKAVTTQEAVQRYGSTFGRQGGGEELLGFERTSFPWQLEEKKEQECSTSEGSASFESDQDVDEAFQKDMEERPVPKAVAPAPERRKRYRFQNVPSNTKEEDSDGEQLWICKKCELPLGDIRYCDEETSCGANSLHGECMAQVMSAKVQKEEAKKLEDDRAEKKDRHQAYDIGWNFSRVPGNAKAASKLAMLEVPEGMNCLVFDEATCSISVAATLEPAAAVNLEYLSTALKVRRQEGHEPIFSLDPVSTEKHPVHEKHSMQEKVFKPEWLAGTSVGDVLFQADYHLKELSMGEYEQPVVGMKSCFEMSHTDEGEWSAREWFWVRKAEMQISDNNALIPFVKMGVEAREQVTKGDELVDKQLTRPDHPMVKYAESFTRNFDLIAERKSVIYHLRELAKTSVMAKYLLDAGIRMEASWFHLAGEADLPCSMEVPQLWNEKQFSKMKMTDKSIECMNNEDKSEGKGLRSHAVYGGVNFGLNKFNLTGGVATARTAQAGLTAGVKGMSLAPGLSQNRLAALGRTQNAQAGLAASVSGGMSVGRLSTMGLARRGAAAPLITSAAPGAMVPAPPAGKVSAPALAPAAAVGATIAPGKLASMLPARGVVPAATALAGQMKAAFLPRGVPTGAPAAILPAYGKQFAPPSLAGVSAPTMPAFAPPSASVSAVSAPRLAPGALTAALSAPRLGAQMSMPPVFAAGLQALGTGVPTAPQLQGVDLRLDNFDLSSAKRVSLEAQEGSWGGDVKALDECVTIGDAFWTGLDDSSKKVFSDDDHAFLSSVFNNTLSDRRVEGDRFVPPDASHSYVTKLRSLVKEEEAVREQRMEAFFSKSFVQSSPSSIFPSSWITWHSISRGNVAVRTADDKSSGNLIARPEYKARAAELVEDVLQSSDPVFDKSTEEGLRFRIYRIGSLEVRTTQQTGREEVVGAVFSIRDTISTCKPDGTVSPQEKITHVTEFVERVFFEGGKSSASRRYYVVVETENGHSILTERLPDGTVTWEEDPAELEDRNSLAKVTRAAQCKSEVVVQDLKTYQSTVAKGASQAGVASPSVCKRFARTAYARVAGSDSKSGAFGSSPWWLDIAREKMVAANRQADAEKKEKFIALPTSMVRKAK